MADAEDLKSSGVLPHGGSSPPPGTMNKRLQDLIAEDAKRLDEAYYAVGDVLDVKASILLVVVTFLGTLSGEILTVGSLPTLIKLFQVASILALCAIGVMVVTCLWTKEFRLPPPPDELQKWVVQLAEHYKQEHDTSDGLEFAVVDEFEKKRAEQTLERITSNLNHARRKGKLIKFSFYLLAPALGLEFLCLVWLAFWHVWR
jgi:hypothetical protein